MVSLTQFAGEGRYGSHHTHPAPAAPALFPAFLQITVARKLRACAVRHEGPPLTEVQAGNRRSRQTHTHRKSFARELLQPGAVCVDDIESAGSKTNT